MTEAIKNLPPISRPMWTYTAETRLNLEKESQKISPNILWQTRVSLDTSMPVDLLISVVEDRQFSYMDCCFQSSPNGGFEGRKAAENVGVVYFARRQA